MSENERTVWVLGAGFSRPLGGPLFSDLISIRTARWVNAWIGNRGLTLDPQKITFDDCVKIFRQGVETSLWRDAEECIALLDEARVNGSVAERVVHSAFEHQNNLPQDLAFDINKLKLDLAQVFARFTQFLAVATSHYVPGLDHDLPESWWPYLHWMQSLGEQDAIVSFNYDLVVELLLHRASRAIPLMKLHGTVPEREHLLTQVRDVTPLTSICVPGPSKLAASYGHLEEVWNAARRELTKADRLVVIGYSFPDSDALARDFVLRYSEATCVDVVVGPDDAGGVRVRDVFDHLKERAMNTKRYAQTFLVEGTARSSYGNFMHLWSSPAARVDLTLDTLASGEFKFGR